MRLRRMFLLLIGCVALSGCGTTSKFTYPADMQRLIRLSASDAYPLSLAVLPFEDQRGNNNSATKILLYLLPLMPYGESYYERPDAASFFNSIQEFRFDASEDLAKAATTSLKRSGLFRKVYFSYGGDTDAADWIMEGEIHSTTYKGKIVSYGLSIIGPLLWFVGLPSGVSTNALDVVLWLHRPNSTERAWEFAFQKESRQIQGLYYYMGHDVRGYALLMEQGMNEAIRDLSNSLKHLTSGDTQ